MEEDIKLINEMIENCRNKKEYYDEKAERKAIALENVLKELELAKESLKDKCDIADERNQLLVENQKKNKVIKKAIRYCNCKSEFQTFGDETLKRALESLVNQVKYEIKEILRVEEQE